VRGLSDAASEVSRVPGARVIFLLAVAAFTSSATMRVADAMLPELARTYSATLPEVARVISYYSIAYGFMQLILGAIGDRYGKFLVITVAVCVSCGGCLAGALAMSLDQLVLARVLTGCAAAGIIPVSLAWIGDRVPYAQRQVTLARLASGTTLGITGGQVMGGVFVDTTGWRGGFVLLSVLFCIAGLLLLRELRRQPAVAEVRGASFVSRIQLVLSSPWARVVLFCSAAEAAMVFAVLALTPTYLQAQLNMSSSVSGGIIAVFGLGALSYTLVARHMVPWLGEARLVLFGCSILGAGLFILGTTESGLIAALVCLIAGFGFYMLHNTLQTNATQLAPEARGTSVALFATLIFMGQAGGVSLGAWMVEHVGPRSVIFSSAAALILLGLGFSLALRRRHR
jgi:YNFM family putative membrane transporter